ncbi:MAG TPA: aminotransferase class V-fold PLP-dependent enzyme [Bacteroidales bacterium]|nr:aminotransferase class V-fold PLP-dependent enzyme [Bacteroidales bacterium]
MTELEKYFSAFRNNITGINKKIKTPYGLKKLVYADWIASGRFYRPIEKRLSDVAGPLIGNTHSEASATGETMTRAYEYAQHYVKKHVNASDEDLIIFSGTGMTSAIVKLQRILGLKIPEQAKRYCYSGNGIVNMCRQLPPEKRPVIFLTHIEHHSNHTSWQETVADVVVLEPKEDLTVDPGSLRKEIVKYRDRPLLIGSFSACSNVTGYAPPFYELAEIMHEHNGYCFVDFAASAPYVKIDMHPGKQSQRLDAIFFSPHKFLGGPGTPGVLIFNKELYKNITPDNPGGGTVKWTNRWGGHSFITDIEKKEDGGTPGFIQAMKAAMAISLKESMDPEKIYLRESEQVNLTFRGLSKVRGLHILAENIKDRLGIFSFYIEGIHHNLITILLNDRYGIQARGGCSCAGTYGHYLLHVDMTLSKEITDLIEAGDLSLKPGWIRLSLHPTTTDSEIRYIIKAIREISVHYKEWGKDYKYDKTTNEFCHKDHCGIENLNLREFFTVS